jgi:hypothetical protein
MGFQKRGLNMGRTNSTTLGTGPHGDTATELEFLERQLQRYSGEGDCAYERSLNLLYRRLFEHRCSQLDALRKAGL